MTDAGLKYVAGMSHLRKLGMSGNAIADAGVAEISNLPQLQELLMVNDKVGDEGLKHSAMASKLNAIWLSRQPKVTTNGVATLNTALPKCNIY